jgi:hypothetical protein
MIVNSGPTGNNNKKNINKRATAFYKQKEHLIDGENINPKATSK